MKMVFAGGAVFTVVAHAADGLGDFRIIRGDGAAISNAAENFEWESRLVGAQSNYLLHAAINGRVDHVCRADNVRLNRLERVVFCAWDLLHGRCVYDDVHIVKRAVQPLFVAHVADEIAYVCRVKSLGSHRELLHLIAAENDDFLRLIIGHQQGSELPSKAARPAGNQNCFFAPVHTFACAKAASPLCRIFHSSQPSIGQMSSASTSTITDRIISSIDSTKRKQPFRLSKIPSIPARGPRRIRSFCPSHMYGCGCILICPCKPLRSASISVSARAAGVLPKPTSRTTPGDCNALSFCASGKRTKTYPGNNGSFSRTLRSFHW